MMSTAKQTKNQVPLRTTVTSKQQGYDSKFKQMRDYVLVTGPVKVVGASVLGGGAMTPNSLSTKYGREELAEAFCATIAEGGIALVTWSLVTEVSAGLG